MFTVESVAGKELRLRAAIPSVNHIHVLTFPGKPPISLSSRKQGSLESKISLHVLPPWPQYLKSIPLFFYGIYFARRYKPITIEAESPLFSGLAAVLIGKLLHIPSLVEVRTTFLSMLSHRLLFIPVPLKRWLVNAVQDFTLKQARIVIVNSRYYHQWLQGKKIHSSIINPGIQNLHSANRLKPASPSTYVLGFLGRLVPEKGAHLFIQAFHDLKLENDIPAITAHIIGDGPEKANLKKLVTRLKLTSSIRFSPALPASKALPQFHILVNPCTVDAPLEMVNAEAAAFGIPVIAFGIKNCPETVLHNQTGLLASKKTSKSLAALMKRLITSPDLFLTYAQLGPTFAKEHYDFTTQVQALMSVYKKLNVFNG